MEAITTDEQNLDSVLTEPHFDEEATVLSARPVVPLNQIKTREKPRKWLVLGAAMLFSLLVGVLGASLIYKQRTQQPAILESDIPEVEGTGKSLDEPPAPAEKPLTVAGSGQVPDTKPITITKAEPATRIRKSLPPVPARVAAPTRTDERVTMADSDDERERRRAERIEERRLRRSADWEEMREARRRRNSSDDLLRIRDIFEGPRRRN